MWVARTLQYSTVLSCSQYASTQLVKYQYQYWSLKYQYLDIKYQYSSLKYQYMSTTTWKRYHVST